LVFLRRGGYVFVEENVHIMMDKGREPGSKKNERKKNVNKKGIEQGGGGGDKVVCTHG
jgi:hypothetical protein